ncbi:hypothetical protein Lal_00038150 [Lupinus albus]|nr:hypothetical protein Lal_00038150 [Lupinus albus]
MGICNGKPIETKQINVGENNTDKDVLPSSNKTKSSSKFPFYSPSPLPSWFKNSPSNSNSNSNNNSVSSTPTPLRIFKRPFPPPSPAKHIRALLARRHGSVKPNEASIPEGSECEVVGLDKSFGFSKQFLVNYELGEEIGRGHFGYTCSAIGKKGTLKGLNVAVKIIPKSKIVSMGKWHYISFVGMTFLAYIPSFFEDLHAFCSLRRISSCSFVLTKISDDWQLTTAIAIEDVRREVKILRALTVHKNLVQFYEAYEDDDNVFIVMENWKLLSEFNKTRAYIVVLFRLCKGGELLDRILSSCCRDCGNGCCYCDCGHCDTDCGRCGVNYFVIETIFLNLSNAVRCSPVRSNAVVLRLDVAASLGGKYPEEDAKVVIIQILSAVAFCHLQGVVHRDLKPENFLFDSKDENSTSLKVIDFGLSDYVKPDERLNDIVGSAYYVAPEVLHRSYGTEADMWSIGVIAYILLCGSRPFWARTESGIFRAVLKAEPSFDETPWPSLSADAIDFVKTLLNKDYRKRLTAAQALSHPWLMNYRDDMKIPLDMIVHKLVKAYICSSSLRKSALRALAKTITVTQVAYLRDQFTMLGPNKNGFISMQNFKTAVWRSSTEASNDSRVLDYANSVCSIQYRHLDFEEFCAAAISVHQLEGLGSWEQHARRAYELFEKDGNRPIMIEELASELGLSPSVPVHVVLQDWISHPDGKLSFMGFVKLLHGISSHTFQKP